MTAQRVERERISIRSFAQVHGDVLDDPRIPMHLKGFFACLRHWSMSNNSSCFYDQQDMVARTGVSERTIRRWLRELEELGLIEVERRGKRRSNIVRTPHIEEDVRPDLNRSRMSGHPPRLPDTDDRNLDTDVRSLEDYKKNQKTQTTTRAVPARQQVDRHEPHSPLRHETPDMVDAPRSGGEGRPGSVVGVEATSLPSTDPGRSGVGGSLRIDPVWTRGASLTGRFTQFGEDQWSVPRETTTSLAPGGW